MPGHLVFVEELEKHSGQKLERIINEISGRSAPAKINIGGPAIVALINASQILDSQKFQISFYGRYGRDANGTFLTSELQKTTLNLGNLSPSDEKATPNTVVLSDPTYDHGAGERTFINSIGAAWEMESKQLDQDFFKSDIVLFGATALTPNIHDDLEQLLKKAKKEGCTTVVSTVFDFRNENAAPERKWPLGQSDESYNFIDLLIMDMVEAQRLSGSHQMEKILEFFEHSGCSSFIITDGSRDIVAYSDGRLFRQQGRIELPVSREVGLALQRFNEGDTTGCGDNFAGGVLASLASQSLEGRPDLIEACSWGVVSGGFSCFYIGGTYSEQYTGEKIEKLSELYQSYREQIEDRT